jgi:hypothetical protein
MSPKIGRTVKPRTINPNPNSNKVNPILILDILSNQQFIEAIFNLLSG